MSDRQPSPRGVASPVVAEATPQVTARSAGLDPPSATGDDDVPPTNAKPRGKSGKGRARSAGSQQGHGSGRSWSKRKVLLLNATFEPLTAVPLRRAVVLVVCGKAEVVHEDPAGLALHAATMTMEMPSVIRLSTYVRVPYRARVPLTRAGLMYRDHYRCAYCGSRADTVDHVVPRSRGGPHSWQNCVACCSKCNHRKADRMLAELGWHMRVVPSTPKGPHWRLLAQSDEADPSWRQYLDAVAA